MSSSAASPSSVDITDTTGTTGTTGTTDEVVVWNETRIDPKVSKMLSKAATVSCFKHGVVCLNSAYVPKATTLQLAGTADPPAVSLLADASAGLGVDYQQAKDSDVNSLFQFGFVLPSAWMKQVTSCASEVSSPDHTGGWCVHTQLEVDAAPDCVYKLCLYMFSGGYWEVVQDNDFIWDTANLPLLIDTVRVRNAVAMHNNKAVSSSTKTRAKQACKDPVFVLGFNRVDMGQLPCCHTFAVASLTMRRADQADHEAAQHHLDHTGSDHQDTSAHILASIRDLEQLKQPIAVLSRDTIAGVCRRGDQTHGILQCTVRGKYRNVQQLQLQLLPRSTAGQLPLAPTMYPCHLAPADGNGAGGAAGGSFGCAVNHLFNTEVDTIEVYFVVAATGLLCSDCPDPTEGAAVGGVQQAAGGNTTPGTEIEIEIDITDLQLVPTSLQTQVTKLYDDADAGESVGFQTIESIKQDVSELRKLTQIIQKSEGPPGQTGKRGAKGERGEAMRFADLTAPQKEELRGQRGVAGPRGKAMVFDDLTPEQRVLLKGEVGDQGDAGKDGEQGPVGPAGPAFTFGDLTDNQRELLRGERGLKGDKGDAMTFEELTDAQKQVLRGEKGERGYKGDAGERGERGRVGPTGPIGPEGKQGPRGLPGVPGAKGDRGDTGEAGVNGKHGRPAVIKTSFLSQELLRDYVQKSLHLAPNTYYIIDHPNDETDHGKLYVYTGEIDIEMTVCCSYVENIMAVLEEYHATVRTTVQANRDEWKVLLTLQSDDISVYHMRRGLENSIAQSGYMVKESLVTEDALQHIGKLCGVQGGKGEPGQRGAAGASMLGMRLDFIGTEATRMKIQEPEPNSVFLQVQPSKSHEAGFYLFEELSQTWKLLQGVDVNSSFLQWMAQYVDNPHQESIPLVLSMFSTTQKQMEGHYNSVRNELQEYRNTNEKWKKYQFEHWKSMGNSQYQQFNTQLSEQSQVMESVVQQVNSVAEKSTGKDEFHILRKHVDKQNDKLERQYKSVRDSLSEYTERQTVDKSVFEQEQEAVQTKLRDLDMSTLKMLKIIQFLKTAPWTKSIKTLKHEQDQHALAHSEFVCQQQKRNKEAAHYIEKACPAQLKVLQDELHKLSDKLASSSVGVDRKFAEWGDQYDKRLLGQATDHTDSVLSLEKRIQTTLDKLKIEITSTTAKKQYTTKQEIVEKCNELREHVYVHEQDNKKMSQTIVKRVEAAEGRLEASLKKQALNTDASIHSACESLQAIFDKRLETTDKDTSAKLLQTFDVLQSERKESEEQYSNTLGELQAQLKQTTTDLTTMTEKLTHRMDEQKSKVVATLTSQIDRCRADHAKHLRDADTQHNETLAALQNDIRQQHTQHLYDIKGTTKKITDVEARVYDDMERKMSTSKTYTDERSRELDQKYNNAVQSLTNDTQSIDAKCSAIDYTLKARMESVEEHIQQLFTEGQQQCESMVDKNKRDTLASLESLRKDTVDSQQHMQQALTSQQTRSESHIQDKLAVHVEHFDRVDRSLLDSKRALESYQNSQVKQHASTVSTIDALRNDMQQQMQEMYRKMKDENMGLAKQLQETKRELLSVVQDRHSELKSDVQQKHDDTLQRTKQQQSQQTQHTRDQLQQIRSIVEGMCRHMDTFTREEQQQRANHEAKLTSVVAVLEKTFAELMAE